MIKGFRHEGLEALGLREEGFRDLGINQGFSRFWFRDPGI